MKLLSVHALEVLEHGGVEHAVCGGVAMVVHGVDRKISDVDILIRYEDLDRAAAVVVAAGYRPARKESTWIDKGTDRFRWSRKFHKTVCGKRCRLDLIVLGPSFDGVWGSRETARWGGGCVSVVSRDGLVTMKSVTGREKDAADIEALSCV